MNTILQQLHLVHDRISNAAISCDRHPDTVQLLAVSKTKPAAGVLTAYQAGQRQFGENYVQEALDKIASLRADCPDIVWHLIGPLQSNKTKPVAEAFDWVQSVSRLKIAERLSAQRPEHLPALNICLQVNISQEASKSGLSITEAEVLAADIAKLPRLCLRGIMAIPEATDDNEKLSAQLVELRQLFDRMAEKHPTIDTLSMGMSNDLELAVACGSTLVRVGTAIFGSRNV
ncbi:YggS family pyridoxal phosphate-dependent enzyme [Oceanisphaera pacifica]|uniref:Pyridoxal phosphate homeostasis protein n=1 Tax=Oceanisphaera pacifica TaxID=2818389 RepID=A0ABS3NCT9_9GAMM|nr:YggS family pyridoxal phosphate-dependent enzyme [Oceanisphaera pacifica]MBO1518193.1 YggS family pyridoxal phosphate-dependent enzyme [Oceanisphaera pacifica]